jgi:hypothetical protein
MPKSMPLHEQDAALSGNAKLQNFRDAFSTLA